MTELMYQVSTGARKKRVLRIPQSHTLYISPNSCARRQGIRALKNDIGSHVSFLKLSEADVATGAYEEQIKTSIKRVLEEIVPRPRVLILSVNCIDDFLGTDFRALICNLSAEYPEVHFMLSRINPISDDVKTGKVQRIQKNLYSLLQPTKNHDKGITLIGAFEPISSNCELLEILAMCRVEPIRYLFDCETFDDYLSLSKSSLAISLSLLGDALLDDFHHNLGMKIQKWPTTWDVDEMEKRYCELLTLLDFADISASTARLIENQLATEKQRTCEVIQEALTVVGDRPLVVDTSASLVPFSLALALRKYGFNVCGVIALHAKTNDLAARNALRTRYPEVSIIERTLDIPSFCRDKNLTDLTQQSNVVAIGVDTRHFLETLRFVDMYHDEGFFGYRGISSFMQLLIHSCDKEGSDV